MLCPRCLRDYAGPHRFCPFDGEALSGRALSALLEGRPSSKQSGVFCQRYAMRAPLGEGAMTRVYQGEDLFTQEPVAIKVLQRPFADRPEIRARFLRESLATARVRHPGVVRVFESGIGDDALPFLILELLPGESLADRLAREQSLHPTTALSLLCQIASALCAAHAAGVVHRDVKPANIVLLGSVHAPTQTAKLVDFGLAKLSEHTGLTQQGIAVGTVEYMAPEQVLSDPVDARTDVYGLGVVMYRLLTGHLPFDVHGVDLLASQLVRPMRSPQHAVFELSDEVRAVLNAALRKQPANRYPTMQAMLDDLERLAGRRTGHLHASCLPTGIDVYEPRQDYSRRAAAFLYRRLGAPLPLWPAASLRE